MLEPDISDHIIPVLSKTTIDEISTAISSLSINDHTKSTDISVFKLPGGKQYQKNGKRLEETIKKNLIKFCPEYILNNISFNYKFNDNGNILVEYDVLFFSDSSKQKSIVSFEIKGVNNSTINDARLEQFIKQGNRQRQCLKNKFPEYNIYIYYCFVVGNLSKKESEKSDESEWTIITKPKISKHVDLDYKFLKKLKDNNFFILTGKSPRQCANNLILELKKIHKTTK